MTNTQSVNDLLNGASGPAAFKFDKVGDTAKGRITKLDTMQVRDYKTQQPRYYDDGNPIMQIVITLEQENGEETRVFCKPAAKAAIRTAVQAAEAEGLEVNGTLAVQYSGDEPADQPGLNPKKQFTAQYKAPVNNISANELL